MEQIQKPSSSAWRAGGIVSTGVAGFFYSKAVDTIHASNGGNSIAIPKESYENFLSQTAFLDIKNGHLIGAADIVVAVIFTLVAAYCFNQVRLKSTVTDKKKSGETFTLTEQHAHLWGYFDIREKVVLNAENTSDFLQKNLKQEIDRESKRGTSDHALVNVFNLEIGSDGDHKDIDAVKLFNWVLKFSPNSVHILVSAFMNHARLQAKPGSDFRGVVHSGLNPFRAQLVQILGQGDEVEYGKWMDRNTKGSFITQYDWNRQGTGAEPTPLFI